MLLPRGHSTRVSGHLPAGQPVGAVPAAQVLLPCTAGLREMLGRARQNGRLPCLPSLALPD